MKVRPLALAILCVLALELILVFIQESSALGFFTLLHMLISSGVPAALIVTAMFKDGSWMRPALTLILFVYFTRSVVLLRSLSHWLTVDSPGISYSFSGLDATLLVSSASLTALAATEMSLLRYFRVATLPILTGDGQPAPLVDLGGAGAPPVGFTQQVSPLPQPYGPPVAPTQPEPLPTTLPEFSSVVSAEPPSPEALPRADT